MASDNKTTGEPEDIFASDGTEATQPAKSDGVFDNLPSSAGAEKTIEDAQAFFFEDISKTIAAAKEYVEETVSDFAGNDREVWANDLLKSMVAAEATLRDLEAKYLEESAIVNNSIGDEVHMFLREVDEPAFDLFVPEFRKMEVLFDEYLTLHLELIAK